MNETSVPNSAKAEIDRRIAAGGAGFVTMIAERLGKSASVTAVYGEPIERNGTTIIPVARVAWGIGGGSGSGTAADGGGTGEGGGGGINASPVGFIEMRDGHAEFRPIQLRPPFWAIAPVVMASGVASLLVLHGLRRVFRG